MSAATRKTLQTIDELCQHALVPPERLGELAEVAARYAVAITPAMADAIDPGDPHDPIARQFVPDARELDRRAEESADPIADDPFSPVEGVVHRYPDRVLLKVVNVCAVYCRFCFRREMVGPGQGGLSPSALAAALDYIATHPEIWEVILSGGDPLVLSARRLKDVVAKLSAIDHVKVIRVHTRDSGRRAGADQRCAGACAAHGQGDIRRAAHQSPARTEQTGAHRLRASDRRRHTDAGAIGAVARGE